MSGATQGMQFVQRTQGPRSVTETKYFDTGIATTNIASDTTWAGSELDPAALTLFYPVEGSDINERVGRKVTVTKIKIRGHITCAAQVNAVAGDDPSVVRLVLYIDQQTNAAQAQGEQLMATPSQAAATNAIAVFQNPANFGRFKVLKDKTLTMQNPNITWDGTNLEQHGIARPFKMNVNFRKGLAIRFNATSAGTVADIVDNSFHLIGLTNSTGLVPRITYECRVVYTDK